MSIGGVTPAQIWELVTSNTKTEQGKIDDKNDEITSLEDTKIAYDHIDNILEQLRGAMQSFTKESSFLGRSVSSSDSDLVVASSNSRAPETSFNFSSISQLATAARVTSTSSLGLTSGTTPFMESSSDINGGTVDDYDPNVPISNAQSAGVITAGTFTINDVEITIDTADTLSTILTKINDAGAGVTAVFEDPTDTVRISGTIVGSDAELTFDDGDTNFFTAMNLSTVTAGTNNEWDKALDDTALSAVTTGYFNINNRTFYVDPTTESLDDVITRVNNSNAGVTMYYDESSNKVIMQNKSEGESLFLSNDSSGFLAAIGVMNQGTDQDALAAYSEYVGDKATFTLNGESLERDTNTFEIQGVTFSLLGTSTSNVSVSITKDKEKPMSVANDFVNQFNATISALSSEINAADGALKGNQTLRTIKNRLVDDVLGKVTNTGQYTTLVDLGFKVERSAGDFFLSIDSEQFRAKLDDDESSVHKLFAYDSDGDKIYDDGGLAVTLRSYLEDFTRSVSGVFYKRQDRLEDLIDDIELDVIDMESDLLALQEKKFDEYAREVQQMQAMQQQASYISAVSQQIAQFI